MRQKLKEITQNPRLQQSLLSLKPKKNLLGFLGILLFFILPEIVHMIWGTDIVTYATLSNASNHSYFNDAVLFIFEGEASWLNLIIGSLFLLWLFF